MRRSELVDLKEYSSSGNLYEKGSVESNLSPTRLRKGFETRSRLENGGWADPVEM